MHFLLNRLNLAPFMTDDFFRACLEQMIDLKHPLAVTSVGKRGVQRIKLPTDLHSTAE
jgi:hypothetical protein